MSDMNLPERARKMMQEAYECKAAKYQRIIRIGHMVFGETNIPEQPLRMSLASESTGTAEPAQRMMMAEFRPAEMTLDEARKHMPFAIIVPAWLPDGFVFINEVQAILPQTHEVEVRDMEGNPAGKHTITSMASVHLRWERDVNGRGIGLDMQPFSPPPADMPVFPIPVPPNSVREVSVNSTPAALITAMHSVRVENSDWANAVQMISNNIELRWALKSVQYSLSATAGDISADDLLRIANSIPTA
jgi:hypothetical protein